MCVCVCTRHCLIYKTVLRRPLGGMASSIDLLFASYVFLQFTFEETEFPRTFYMTAATTTAAATTTRVFLFPAAAAANVLIQEKMLCTFFSFFFKRKKGCEVLCQHQLEEHVKWPLKKSLFLYSIPLLSSHTTGRLDKSGGGEKRE